MELAIQGTQNGGHGWKYSSQAIYSLIYCFVLPGGDVVEGDGVGGGAHLLNKISYSRSRGSRKKVLFLVARPGLYPPNKSTINQKELRYDYSIHQRGTYEIQGGAQYHSTKISWIQICRYEEKKNIHIFCQKCQWKNFLGQSRLQSLKLMNLMLKIQILKFSICNGL